MKYRRYMEGRMEWIFTFCTGLQKYLGIFTKFGNLPAFSWKWGRWSTDRRRNFVFGRTFLMIYTGRGPCPLGAYSEKERTIQHHRWDVGGCTWEQIDEDFSSLPIFVIIQVVIWHSFERFFRAHRLQQRSCLIGSDLICGCILSSERHGLKSCFFCLSFYAQKLP